MLKLPYQLRFQNKVKAWEYNLRPHFILFIHLVWRKTFRRRCFDYILEIYCTLLSKMEPSRNLKQHYLCISLIIFFYKKVNASKRSPFHVVLLSPVGNVEASQVVGSVTEEVQQGVARLRHHLRNRLVSITLRNNQPTAMTTHKWNATYFYYHLYIFYSWTDMFLKVRLLLNVT